VKLTPRSCISPSATTVAGGQLFVDGWLGGSSIRVLDGAPLGGNGVVPSVTIGGGGVLAPGRRSVR
jgi:hypothetical protein